MKQAKSLIIAAAFVAVGSLTFVGCKAGDHHDHSTHSHGASAAHSHDSTAVHGHNATAKPYLLKTCIVSDDGFDHGTPIVLVHEGQEIKLCCEDCRKPFEKDPAKYLRKLSQAK